MYAGNIELPRSGKMPFKRFEFRSILLFDCASLARIDSQACENSLQGSHL